MLCLVVETDITLIVCNPYLFLRNRWALNNKLHHHVIVNSKDGRARVKDEQIFHCSCWMEHCDKGLHTYLEKRASNISWSPQLHRWNWHTMFVGFSLQMEKAFRNQGSWWGPHLRELAHSKGLLLFLLSSVSILIALISILICTVHSLFPQCQESCL